MRRFGKYRAVKSQCSSGHTHDSKKEAAYCNALHIRLEAGEISDLQTSVQFWFVIDGKALKHRNGRRVGYLADFSFIENGHYVVVEVKGFSVRDWPLRRAIFCALYPNIDFREV